MAERKVESTVSLLSTAAAVLCATCNLVCCGLSNYQHFYVEREPVWIPSFIILQCLLLAPLLALFIFRRFAVVVFLYAIALLSTLVLHIDQFGHVQKIDMASLLLSLLGAISIVVVVVWATIRWIVLIRNAPKSRWSD